MTEAEVCPPSAIRALVGSPRPAVFPTFAARRCHPPSASEPSANKYVVTAGAAQFAWANSHPLRSIDEMKRMKAGDGADIVLWGSSTLYPQLLEADLIDRIVLLTYPIALEKGKRLFGSTTHPVSMKLVNSEVSSTGVIIATYDQAG